MREPDIEGVAGKAWEVVRPPGGPPAWQGGVASWVMNVPGAHPFWSWWTLNAVHLRPIEGVRPAFLRFPEATHEFLICALDPASYPPPVDVEPETCFAILQPIDLVHQVSGLDDGQAARVAALMMRAIVDGRMSPDQDYRSAWRRLIDGTAEHLRAGKHPLQ